MPPLSRWYIKLATLYLVAGLIVSIIQALPAGLRPSLFALTGPAYIPMLVVGWTAAASFAAHLWRRVSPVGL